jgi:hypothetical protein
MTVRYGAPVVVVVESPANEGVVLPFFEETVADGAERFSDDRIGALRDVRGVIGRVL